MSRIEIQALKVNEGIPPWLPKRLERHSAKNKIDGNATAITDGLQAIAVTVDGEDSEIAMFTGGRLLAVALYERCVEMGLACQCKDFQTQTAVSVYNYEVAR